MRLCTGCGSTSDGTNAFCVTCGTPLASDATGGAQPTAPAMAAVPPWTSAVPPPPTAPWPVADDDGYAVAAAAAWDGGRGAPQSKLPILAAVLVLLLLAVGGGGYLLSRPDRTNTAAAAGTGIIPGDPSNSPAEPPTSSSSPTQAARFRSGPARELTSSALAFAPSQAPNGVDKGNNPVSYMPSNMLDGILSTAWRTHGDATGQILSFTLPASGHITSVGLVNGYSKIDPVSGEDRYRQERRIVRVTWLFDDGSSTAQNLTDGVASLQSIELPEPGPATGTVRLRVDSTTTPGDANFDYTAISDVQIFGSSS